LLRSDDLANSWVTDEVGLQQGQSRILYSGALHNYVLTSSIIDEMGTSSTYIQKREKSLPLDSDWDSNSEVLPMYIYAMVEFDNKLYLATEDGLYSKIDNSLNNPVPNLDEFIIKVYPIPSSNATITIESDYKIEQIAISDLQGRLVYSSIYEGSQISVPEKGIFILTVTGEKGVTSTKIVMQ
jgi:hypothetical protein